MSIVSKMLRCAVCYCWMAHHPSGIFLPGTELLQSPFRMEFTMGSRLRRYRRSLRRHRWFQRSYRRSLRRSVAARSPMPIVARLAKHHKTLLNIVKHHETLLKHHETFFIRCGDIGARCWHVGTWCGDVCVWGSDVGDRVEVIRCGDDGDRAELPAISAMAELV